MWVQEFETSSRLQIGNGEQSLTHDHILMHLPNPEHTHTDIDERHLGLTYCTPYFGLEKDTIFIP